MESLGFTVTVGDPVASSQTVGTVAMTDPAPGTAVSKGYPIVIYPSDGSLYVDMPNLIGNNATTTTATLVGLGYSASKINYLWVSTADPLLYCKVKSTNPAAGPSSKDASVTITVNSVTDGMNPPGCNP